jgi:hypothetical protein
MKMKNMDYYHTVIISALKEKDTETKKIVDQMPLMCQKMYFMFETLEKLPLSILQTTSNSYYYPNEFEVVMTDRILDLFKFIQNATCVKDIIVRIILFVDTYEKLQKGGMDVAVTFLIQILTDYIQYIHFQKKEFTSILELLNQSLYDKLITYRNDVDEPTKKSIDQFIVMAQSILKCKHTNSERIISIPNLQNLFFQLSSFQSKPNVPTEFKCNVTDPVPEIKPNVPEPIPNFKELKFNMKAPVPETKPNVIDFKFNMKSPVLLEPNPNVTDFKFNMKSPVPEPKPNVTEFKFNVKGPVLEPIPNFTELKFNMKAPVPEPKPKVIELNTNSEEKYDFYS